MEFVPYVAMIVSVALVVIDAMDFSARPVSGDEVEQNYREGAANA